VADSAEMKVTRLARSRKGVENFIVRRIGFGL
jgi:hypothetical protein